MSLSKGVTGSNEKPLVKQKGELSLIVNLNVMEQTVDRHVPCGRRY